MELNVPIAKLENGAQIQGYYVFGDIQIKKASSGRPYMSAVMSDATGSIDTKVWDFNGSADSSDNGRVVLIRGQVSEYRGSLQVSVNRFRFAGEQDRGKYDLNDLVASAPVSSDGELTYVRELLATVADEDYRRVGETMLERHLAAFASLPAAKSIHHGFRGGLLMHTAGMLRMADFAAGNYPEIIDRSLLLVGTLLHDFAKEQEYALSQLGLVTDYTVRGELLGHLVMGAMEVAEVARELDVPEEKSVLLQHLLLSHHGQPEMGAAVKPKCAEAEMLSLIDLIDSRMEIYTELCEPAAPGTLLPRVFALEKRIYKHK